MGNIVTFYSYKGGVGRSMALANSGVILAQWGYKVLLIDFDLEAPGLESFFDAFIDIKKVKAQKGLVDYLHAQFFSEHARPIGGAPTTIRVRLPRISGHLDILTAGKRDDGYFKRVTDLDFRNLYETKNAGRFFEQFRLRLKEKYDFALIDSRTGLTDIGGVCTVQLPDYIVLVSTATDQALMGGLDIVRRASDARQKMPYPRAHVPILPIPSRFDSSSELRLTKQWLDRFATELTDIYAHWLPRLLNPRDFLDVTKLPYVPFFSYGESLPALEYGTRDPSGLGYAYETLAALIARSLTDVDQLLESRDSYVRKAVRDSASSAPSHDQPRVFISYSHADERWVQRLRVHLAPLTRSRDITILSDADIKVGEPWRAQINETISKADVAVLLISSDYLASDWVAGNELPLLLKAAEERGLRILWLPIGPSLYEETAISQFQALSDPSKPLEQLRSSDQEKVIAAAVKRIADVAGRRY